MNFKNGNEISGKTLKLKLDLLMIINIKLYIIII
jgi:hypothetical protein